MIKNIIFLIYYYRGFFIKTFVHEIYYSLKFNKFILKRQKTVKGLIDPTPTPYYFLKIVKNFLIEYKIKSILDIGSGTGRALNFFSDIKGLELTGIEARSDLINISKNLTNKKIKYIFSLFQNFNLEHYDCYFMCDTLHENDFNSFLKYLENLKRSKKNNIYFIYINGQYIKSLIKNTNFQIIKYNYNDKNAKPHIKGLGIFKI